MGENVYLDRISQELKISGNPEEAFMFLEETEEYKKNIKTILDSGEINILQYLLQMETKKYYYIEKSKIFSGNQNNDLEINYKEAFPELYKLTITHQEQEEVNKKILLGNNDLKTIIKLLEKEQKNLFLVKAIEFGFSQKDIILELINSGNIDLIIYNIEELEDGVIPIEVFDHLTKEYEYITDALFYIKDGKQIDGCYISTSNIDKFELISGYERIQQTIWSLKEKGKIIEEDLVSYVKGGLLHPLKSLSGKTACYKGHYFIPKTKENTFLKEAQIYSANDFGDTIRMNKRVDYTNVFFEVVDRNNYDKCNIAGKSELLIDPINEYNKVDSTRVGDKFIFKLLKNKQGKIMAKYDKKSVFIDRESNKIGEIGYTYEFEVIGENLNKTVLFAKIIKRIMSDYEKEKWIKNEIEKYVPDGVYLGGKHPEYFYSLNKNEVDFFKESEIIRNRSEWCSVDGEEAKLFPETFIYGRHLHHYKEIIVSNIKSDNTIELTQPDSEKTYIRTRDIKKPGCEIIESSEVMENKIGITFKGMEPINTKKTARYIDTGLNWGDTRFGGFYDW